MFVHKMTERVWQLPAVHWNRRLFDALIPLPDGTSYNAYFIKGSEKRVLIDAADPALEEGFLEALAGLPAVDYIISNHAEQDHSGILPKLLERYPGARILATPKAKPMLVNLLHIPEETIQTVEDGETLSLGDVTLEFLHMPWVHWPETMVTYLREEKILFSCDFFGSHLATSSLYVPDEWQVYEAAKRYYAEIMMPFARHIRKHLERLAGYDIAVIAPSHGPAYNRPAFILDAYRDWVLGEPKNIALIPYVSMHGSTEMMAHRLADSLVAKGVNAQLFDLASMDIGKLAIAMVDAGSIILGMPTVEAGPHPYGVFGAVLINALRPKAKYFSIFGSYLWGTKAVATIQSLVTNLSAQFLEPVYVRGLPRKEDLEALDRLAEQIAQGHRAAGLR
jgi:flavorubredoxin